MQPITPCKRKSEDAEAVGNAAHATDGARSEERSPKRARQNGGRVAATTVDYRGEENRPRENATRLKSVISDSVVHQATNEGEALEPTMPSPPSASFFADHPGAASDQDQKMPAIIDPDTPTNSLQHNESQQFASQGASVNSVTSGHEEFSALDHDDSPFPEHLADVATLDSVYRKAAAITSSCWILLVLVTYTTYFRWENNHDTLLEDAELNYDDAAERMVPQTAFFILLVSTVVQMVPIVLSGLKQMNTTTANTSPSGIMIAAMVILSISLITNALLGWGPRAVVIDPVSGSRVFLLRWVEWIPLSGFMTLLAESSDIAAHKGAWRKPIIFALCQSLSTLCGILFPYCQNTTQWVVTMIISCALFVQVFPRVHARRTLFHNTPKGRNVLEREYYDRRRFGYYLMVMCSILWSSLVTLYFINMVVHMVAPPDHWLRFKSLAMSCDTIFDVAAKVVYNRIIFDAHQAVFASHIRAAQQLNELKQLMSMLWICSSDVIIVSTNQTKSRTATILSPSFLQLVGANLPLQTSMNPQDTDQMDAGTAIVSTECSKQSIALVLVTEDGKLESAYYVDTSAISEDPHSVLAYEDLQHNAVSQAFQIINKAWTSGNETNLNNPCGPLYSLSIDHCDPSRSGKIMCEMKVSCHTKQTVVAVVRDVTERYRRFEAESRAHAETIARQRDMHTANRFTRHEVKNGLLASIELCRTLGQSLNELKAMLLKSGPLGQRIAAHLDNKSLKSLVDLDSTLRGVLDTVLAEVMAREVVHEVYQPRLEELDVPAMLVSNLGMSKDRIPVTIGGGSMPKLLLDAQLIGHIHRNAVSNACKYGKQGGDVKTFVEFDADKKEFRMEVRNEPGIGHDTLLAMGETASEFVFAQGVRLQPHMKGKTEKKLDSSGDGAWIMQKCAKTMNGVCNIYFTKDVTRFTLCCPAVPATQNSQPNYSDFVVPDNVWGIGVDDSKIQRKLLSRILTHAGVHPSRQLLLGETHEDITEFESTLMNLMDQHSTMKFLVIVDEHLDYDNLAKEQHAGIHSGSLMMKQILDNLPKLTLSRLLVLMRSANDSAVDMSLYTERTHGYFPKAIMQRDRTREILAPLWLSRFPEDAP